MLYRKAYSQSILEDINISGPTGWCCVDGSKERCSGKRFYKLHDGKGKGLIVKRLQVERLYEYDGSCRGQMNSISRLQGLKKVSADKVTPCSSLYTFHLSFLLSIPRFPTNTPAGSRQHIEVRLDLNMALRISILWRNE